MIFLHTIFMTILVISFVSAQAMQKSSSFPQKIQKTNEGNISFYQ